MWPNQISLETKIDAFQRTMWDLSFLIYYLIAEQYRRLHGATSFLESRKVV